MSEELCLEDAVDQRIRLLCADNQREPIVLQVGRADGFDGANRYRSFGRDAQLIIDDVLRYNIYMSTRL